MNPFDLASNYLNAYAAHETAKANTAEARRALAEAEAVEAEASKALEMADEAMSNYKRAA